MKMDFSRD